MQYKKFFSAAALVTLLSVSNYLSADPMGSEDEGETSYYVRGQYNAEFFNIMSGKELKLGSGDSPASLISIAKATGAKTETTYKPSYKTTFIAGSAAAGLKMEDNIGVELEVLYSQLDVDGADYKASSGGTDKPDNAKVFGKLAELTGADAANATGTNEGFKTIAAMVNAYYYVDLGNDSIPVNPYVGAGVGVARTTFAGADHWKPAYQAKAGVSYAVTPEIKVYGGYRYFGLYGNEFKDAILKHTTSGTTTETKVTLQQDGMYGVHGVEAGVMFNF